jgi:hypothetical protein
MTSSDLVVPVQGHEEQITVRVLLLSTEDVSTEEAANRLRCLLSAVCSGTSIELVILINGRSDAHGGLPAIVSLQNLFVSHFCPEPT